MNLIQSAIYTSSILNGNKKRPKRIKVSSNQFYPWAVERAAAQWLKKYFKGHFKQVANSLLLEAGLSLQFDEKENFDNENDLESFANSLFTKVNENAIKTHHNYFVKLRIENMGVAGGEQLREDFVERFVENCRSTGEQEKNAIAQAIYNYKTQRGTPQKSLAEEIKEINENYSDKKAAFIARNEVSNLNASISEAQAQEGGFEMYEWLATGDEATRESHAALNGLICRYDDNSVYSDDGGKTWKKRTAAMYNGAPGFDYNCRCCAAPFDPEIFEETEIENEGEDGNENAEKNENTVKLAEIKLNEAKKELKNIQKQFEELKEKETRAKKNIDELKQEKARLERAEKASAALGYEKIHDRHTAENALNDIYSKNWIVNKYDNNKSPKLNLGEEKDVNNNGSADGVSKINLSPKVEKFVISGLEKIRNGNVLNYEEEDGFFTLWHETNHNRHNLKVDFRLRLTETERKYMELSNEFVSRNSIQEFYNFISGNTYKMHYPILIENRPSTYYNKWVVKYKKAIDDNGLDFQKVYESVKRGLLNSPLAKQKENLKNALIINSRIKKGDKVIYRISEKEARIIVENCLK